MVELMDLMYIKVVLNIKLEDHNTKLVEHYIKLVANIKPEELKEELLLDIQPLQPINNLPKPPHTINNKYLNQLPQQLNTFPNQSNQHM